MRRPPRAVITATLVLPLLLPALAAAAPSSGEPVAGGLAAETSPRVPAQVGEVRPFNVDAPDGTVLRGHVYLPEGEGPFATVLELSPYWGTTYPRTGEALRTDPSGRRTTWSWLAPFSEAGFAVALVNVRGTDQSGGCLQWGTRVDARDGALVVSTLAAQPWSNGRVGMIGHSYPAWMAYATLTERPPALRALAIASGIIDPWNLMTRNGAAFVLGPPAMPAATAGLTTGALGLSAEPGASTLLATPPEHVACPRYADDTTPSAEMIVGGDRNAYWDAVDLRPRIRGTDVAVLVANGMQQEGHMLQIDGLWPLLGPARRMILGQWNHVWPHKGGREDWQQMSVDWFDQHLRGAKPKVEAGVVEYQVEGGTWREAATWPPPAARAELFLRGNAIAASPSGGVDEQRTFTASDSDPAPADCPDRQVIFASPPLAGEVVLAGSFELDLTITSTLPDGNLAAVLFSAPEVGACPAPSPPSSQPLAGYLKMPGEIRRALVDLRHAGAPYGRLFPVGVPTEVELTSHPLATRIPAGHRLILAVGGGARELFPEARKPRLTLTTGAARAAALRLPVVEGELRFSPEG